jgi:hypothetical protein
MKSYQCGHSYHLQCPSHNALPTTIIYRPSTIDN